MNLKKELGGVAAAVAKVMEAELSPKQKAIAKLDEPKNKIDAGDLAKLRAGHKPVKEEEVKLTKEEAEMLASLSQEEFNSLTEEEQDLFIEYFQPLDEISTGAAKNYLKKAVPSSSKLNRKAAKPGEDKASETNYMDMDAPYETKEFQKFSKRRTGIRKAINKLASAHPDNKKLATTARQAFNKMHNANYRIGMDGAKNTPDDVKHVKKQHSIIHKAVNAMKENAEQIDELKKSTLGSYVKKASQNLSDRSFDHGEDEHRQYGMGDDDEEDKRVEKDEKKIATRQQGINRAASKLSKEEVETLDEVSLKTKVSAYVKRMAGDGPDLDKGLKTITHIANRHGVKGVARAARDADREYGLNNIHNPRKDFVKSVMADVKKEEVEQIDENAMHGTVYLHKYHEGSSEDSYGEVGKGHTQHAHYVYHKAPGKKPKLLGDVEHNVNNKTKKTAHAVARTDKMEQDHKSQSDAVQHLMDLHGVHPATPIRHITDKKQMNEEVEQIDEYKSTGGVYKHKGTYGTEKSEKAGYTDYEKENEMAKKELKTKKGPRQNYIRSTRVNESFTDMLEAYKEHGLSVFVKEEPTEDQFNKEIKDQIAMASGKKKQPGVATPETMATKEVKEETHTEVEVYDFTDANGVKVSTIDLDERTLSKPEAKKKEEIVKSMKKKMPGFKERYGERAKSVMYATATKLAKKD